MLMTQVQSLYFELTSRTPSASKSIGYSLGILALWKMLVVIRMHANRPKNIPIKHGSFFLGHWLFNLEFIRDAPLMVSRAYKELNNASFAIPALTEYQVLACLESDARAVSEASEQMLSFHAAMTDRLKHKYTMFGFEHNEVDPHNAVPARTLKVLLRKHLPDIRPIIQKRIIQVFELEFDRFPETSNGWKDISAFGLARRITERVNTQICLGTELAESSKFMQAARRYNHDAIVAAEICRQLPSIFTPLIAPMVMNWSGAMREVGASIKEVVQARLYQQKFEAKDTLDCIQWIIQSSRTEAQRSLERLVQQTGALFFASSHQMPMAFVYAIYSLCIYPKYIDLLRQEAAEKFNPEKKDPLKPLVLLEAFLRESARLNPLDALSIQRKVLQPFQLPSGARIPAGNLVAVPQQAVLRNEHLYPEPESFNPFRYLPQDKNSQGDEPTIRYTDVTSSFPYWGSTRKPCPGRWYVSETMKLAILHLITNYDIRLEGDKVPRSFFWTTALVPRMDAKILLKKLQNGL
ncbi:cytochrome P450 [Lentithecium fluviatile CBS 122367]|uniref:Cytochrome P450 n=1 Tax=Lentithecium fluviatile CBS 122367 TaxID=1168545 RepID=A0A6G1JN25_9PLEO|nr:cytochrome P450 [Lentithecium fluviatile CBS 122367]